MTMEIINVGGPDNALWASECHFSKNEFQHEKKSWEIIFKVQPLLNCKHFLSQTFHLKDINISSFEENWRKYIKVVSKYF